MPNAGRTWVRPLRATISQPAATSRHHGAAPETGDAQHRGRQTRHVPDGGGEVGVRLVGLVDHASLHPRLYIVMLHRDKSTMNRATLTISSKNYSSWSLRGWLMVRMSGLPFDEEVVPLTPPGELARRRCASRASRTPA